MGLEKTEWTGPLTGYRKTAVKVYQLSKMKDHKKTGNFQPLQNPLKQAQYHINQSKNDKDMEETIKNYQKQYMYLIIFITTPILNTN